MIRVVDASVAVRWVVAEPLSDEAVALLTQKAKLVAPELLRLEASNALVRKFRLGTLPEALARAALTTLSGHLDAGLLELVPDSELAPRAVELAIQLKHPVYDCLYLALAERTGGVYVTADAVFVDKLAKSPWARLVSALGS